MLGVTISRVHPDRVEQLRAWMAELARREPEVQETFAQERLRHEVAYLLETSDGPILIYTIEAEDVEQARAVFQASSLPIDREHFETMRSVIAGPAGAELLLDLTRRELDND